MCTLHEAHVADVLWHALNTYNVGQTHTPGTLGCTAGSVGRFTLSPICPQSGPAGGFLTGRPAVPPQSGPAGGRRAEITNTCTKAYNGVKSRP